MSLNMAIIVGRAGRDGETKSTSSGTAMATVSIATDYWKGKGQKTTEWHNIVAFGSQAEKLAKVNKGDLVQVIGRMSSREYTNRDGNKVRSFEIIANRVDTFIDRGQELREAQEASGNANTDPADEYDDGLPF